MRTQRVSTSYVRVYKLYGASQSPVVCARTRKRTRTHVLTLGACRLALAPARLQGLARLREGERATIRSGCAQSSETLGSEAILAR